MARAKHKMAKLWMLKSGGDIVDYIFPRTKFVDETPIDKQLEHFASECKEIIERIENGDFIGIVEETLDMIHSGETFLRKAEEQHGVDVGLVKEKVILKNDKRGYYEINKFKRGDEEILVLVEAAKEKEKWKMENCYKNKPRCRTCCSGGIMLGSFCKEGRELFNES